MAHILAKELKLKFVETLNTAEDFTYEEGNPFLSTIGGKRFFIFLKNISPAYFANSPDITRVQLPYSEHFKKVVKARIPFVILGYDTDNDTFVCWNPEKVKQRLNAKGNISLYSRKSLQANVNPSEFKTGILANGEKIVLFQRKTLPLFFDSINSIFHPQMAIGVDSDGSQNMEDSSNIYVEEKLTEITDKTLLSQIEPLLKKNGFFEAVKLCGKYYGQKYQNMSLRDWFNVVDNVYRNVNATAAAEPSRHAESQRNAERPPHSSWSAGCAPRIAACLGVDLHKCGRAVFSDDDGKHLVVCLVSKVYSQAGTHYWFGFTPKQKKMLDGTKGYVALGCGSANNILLIPFAEFSRLLPKMSITERSGGFYWHIIITENAGRYVFDLRGKNNKYDGTKYLI